LKIVKLDPNEIEYCSTLEWKFLMIYLEKKYGIKFQQQFEKQIMEKVENNINEGNEKENWK
jgi:hypothetical protein